MIFVEVNSNWKPVDFYPHSITLSKNFLIKLFLNNLFSYCIVFSLFVVYYVILNYHNCLIADINKFVRSIFRVMSLL